MKYKTIAAPCTRTLIEKRSEFIAAVTPVQTAEQAIACIQDAHAAYRKARHHVYAYVLRDQNISRYSDDGEPQGTAGLPVLDVIRKQGLTDVCCVVSRISAVCCWVPTAWCGHMVKPVPRRSGMRRPWKCAPAVP